MKQGSGAFLGPQIKSKLRREAEIITIWPGGENPPGSLVGVKNGFTISLPFSASSSWPGALGENETKTVGGYKKESKALWAETIRKRFGEMVKKRLGALQRKW